MKKIGERVGGLRIMGREVPNEPEVMFKQNEYRGQVT